MSDWKTAWKTGAIKITEKDQKCGELLMWPFHKPVIHFFMYSKPSAEIVHEKILKEQVIRFITLPEGEEMGY